MREVHLLTDAPRTILEKTRKHGASSRARARAPGLFLSGPGVTIKASATMAQGERDTVSPWSTPWAPQGAARVPEQPRSGRPPTLTPAEHARALTSMQEAPRSRTQVVERCAQKTAQRLRMAALTRRAKRARRRGKRVRKSGTALREPEACAHGPRALEALQPQAAAGKSPRYACAAAGCALAPSLPSAWQASGEVLARAARREGRLHVLGCRHRHKAWHASLGAPSGHRGGVLACCDALCHTMTPKTVVVLDHASLPPSEACEERMPGWRKQGVILPYLPPYAPACHLLDILWRHLTYRWIPFSASQGLHAFIEALENILSNVGATYQITFA